MSSRSLRGAYGALNGVYWMLCCLAYSFSSNFLLGRGYSNSALGAIVAAGYILGLALQTPAAALADRTARAPLAVIGGSAAAVGAVTAAVLFLPGRGPVLRRPVLQADQREVLILRLLLQDEADQEDGAGPELQE